MVDQFYKMLEIKDEKDASKLANAGILYSLVNILFQDTPGANSDIKRMQTYIAFARKNGFSEKELVYIKLFLFNSARGDSDLSARAILYRDFIGELSKSVALFVEDYKNGNPLLENIGDAEAKNKAVGEDTNMKLLLFFGEMKSVLKKFVGHKNFPEKFSDISFLQKN